eukprot:scaffold187595_cov18-Tisochrysis_lutea.AAC.1
MVGPSLTTKADVRPVSRLPHCGITMPQGPLHAIFGRHPQVPQESFSLNKAKLRSISGLPPRSITQFMGPWPWPEHSMQSSQVHEHRLALRIGDLNK